MAILIFEKLCAVRLHNAILRNGFNCTQNAAVTPNGEKSKKRKGWFQLSYVGYKSTELSSVVQIRLINDINSLAFDFRCIFDQPPI